MTFRTFYFVCKGAALLPVLVAVYATMKAGEWAGIAFACGLLFCIFDHYGEAAWKESKRSGAAEEGVKK